MKKSLLFAALIAGAMSASAQTEICFSDPESAGLASDKATFAGGTVVGKSESVTMSLAYEDSWGASSISHKGYTGAVVNGTEVTFANGVVGNTNPAGTTLSAEGWTAPTGGAVLQFDVTKDGYLVVFGKLSSNKPYYVWEGLSGKGEMPVAYTLAMDWSDADKADMPTIFYELPADELGYVDCTAADINTYILEGTTALTWPERIAYKDPESNVAKNGVGAIIFPVYAEAGSYLVHATGSKITTCGAVFTTEPVTSVVLTGADVPNVTFTLGEGGETGISAVKPAESANGAKYNLAGQQVDDTYKGVVIQNGKKSIQK